MTSSDSLHLQCVTCGHIWLRSAGERTLHTKDNRRPRDE